MEVESVSEEGGSYINCACPSKPPLKLYHSTAAKYERLQHNSDIIMVMLYGTVPSKSSLRIVACNLTLKG